MANKYNINKISRLFFPWFWQTTNNMALINVLMSVFDQVNGDYGTYEALAKKEVGYNIQKLSLETSLNDEFDSDEQRIYIQNGSVTAENYIYNEAETAYEETYVYNESETADSETYVYNNGEASTESNTGFTVYVPSELEADYNDAITAWIDRVKITGTLYEIVYV